MTKPAASYIWARATGSMIELDVNKCNIAVSTSLTLIIEKADFNGCK